MKKMLLLVLCVGLVPVFAADAEANVHQAIPVPAASDHAFRLDNVGSQQYPGTRSTPTVVDQIDLSPVNASGYCWGITYDWERDCLWITQWNSGFPYMYAIQKTSPCVKLDSVLLGSGVPTYRLGIGYGGGDVMYMAGFDGNVYQIDMNTGTGAFYRATPWGGDEGLGFNAVDDAVYAGDWGADACGYAQPAQTGSWTTWTLSSVSGLSGAHSASTSPQWLFTCNEDASQAYFYQHSMSGGVPNTTPDSIWDLPAGMTQQSTADCAFDGQYIYVLDQSGPDMVWVFDVGLTPSPSYFWDFEDGHQGWTHTNGQAYPAGWDVQWYSMHSDAESPSPGDSSYWVDSDAAGTSIIVNDTAWSPAVTPPAGMQWFKWGCGYQNFAGVDTFTVGLRVFTGGMWQAPVRVQTYSTDIGPGVWDSVDVSGYASADSIQLFFAYNYGDYTWYASFDNVELTVAAGHDAGATDIAAPAATILPNSNIDPIATYKNHGGVQETFDCYFEIDSSGTNLYSEYTSVTLDPGADTTITWPTWTVGPDGVTYDVMAFTMLGGDQNPGNDTLAMTSTTSSWLFWDDGAPSNAWAWNYADWGWGVQFIAPDTVYVDSFAVYFWDSSWPVPGSNLSDFGLYDGAAQPTNVRQSWTDATIVRGAWNKFPTDTSLTLYNPGDNIYMMWFQTAAYPDCPGLACDAAIDMGAYQWWYNDPDTWGTGALSGDWLIRVHIIGKPEGISEWIDTAPEELSLSVAGISRNSIAIRFTLPYTSKTSLVLYDATGRRLETLVSNTLSAGIHQYTTDLDLAAGVYFVTLTTEHETITKKSLIVK